jgi:hypothetical protein
LFFATRLFVAGVCPGRLSLMKNKEKLKKIDTQTTQNIQIVLVYPFSSSGISACTDCPTGSYSAATGAVEPNPSSPHA